MKCSRLLTCLYSVITTAFLAASLAVFAPTPALAEVSTAGAEGTTIFQPADSSKLELFRARVFNGLVDLETEIDVSEIGISESEIKYTYPGTNNVVTGLRGFTSELRNHVIFAPGYTWSSCVSFTTADNGTISTVNISSYPVVWSSALMSAFKTNYADFINNAPTSGSDFQKAAYVHDWVCAHTSYSMNTASLPDFALGSIANGRALCAGFSYAYKFLANQLGLDCNYVSGTTKVEAHAWNKVKIDGQWFLVDTTWDRAVASATTFGHTYFMLNDTEFATAGDGSHDSDTDVVNNDPVNTDYYFANKFWEGASGPLSAEQLAQDPQLTKVKTECTEHEWDEGVVTVEPTTTSEGVRTYTCKVCGATKTEAIPKLDPEPKPDPTPTPDPDPDPDPTPTPDPDPDPTPTPDPDPEPEEDTPTEAEKPYSAVYSYSYYVANNPDVAAAFNGDRTKTLNHFINYGMKEGRASSKNFDVDSYYNANQDLRAAFGTNLAKYYTHYMNYGQKEGRACTGVSELQNYRTSLDGTDYSAVYDGAYYRENNADLDKAFTKAVSGHVLFDDTAMLRHFVNYGMKEGRVSSAGFDVLSYYNANQDLRAAFGMNLKSYYMHYVNYGKKEGRSCADVSELKNYRSTLDGTDYSAVYDGAYYRKNNSDLDKAFTKNVSGYSFFDDTALLRHFVNYGMKEGRQASASFSVQAYKNRYSDLRKAYGNNLKSYYLHYLKYGKREGRVAV